MKEIWKDIVGFENMYQISNYGNVKSLERIVPFGRSYRTIKERIVNKYDNGKGYLYVKLYKKHKETDKYVHRLVAESFLINPNEYPQVNHIDENKQNNMVENLEWCSVSYNIKYANGMNKRLTTRIKNGAKTAERPVLQFSLNGDFIKEFKSAYQANRELNIHEPNIRESIKRKNGTCGGFRWVYK
ncbi:NUMOD4 domain-containing protein [Petrimonas sulfuriphila]|uniref:NUMOD4 domain-containing protein n=1 Tax=Petrimonas sulfuriphila TaxID=285070 RepID=UPI003EBB2780